MTLDNIFKVSDICKKYKLSEETVRRYQRDLGIPVCYIGKAVVFTAEEAHQIGTYKPVHKRAANRSNYQSVEGMFTSRQAAAMIDPNMNAMSFVCSARNLGLHPAATLDKEKEKAYWTIDQINEYKALRAQRAEIARQKQKKKAKGVKPLMPRRPVVAPEDSPYVVEDAGGATYYRLKDAPRPFDISSIRY